MAFGFFDSAATVAFAKEIALDVQTHFPNTPEPATVKTIEKGRKKLDAIIARTKSFADQNKPNIYKKAKFLNTIKWELKESGHDPLFINEMVRLLAVVMN